MKHIVNPQRLLKDHQDWRSEEIAYCTKVINKLKAGYLQSRYRLILKELQDDQPLSPADRRLLKTGGVMKIILKRHLNALCPAFSGDLDKIHKLEEGVSYRATITRPRNLQHHRKYWAFISLVFDNLPESLENKFKNSEELHYEIKLQTGHREKYTTLGGQETWKVKSISFEKMDQTEFEEFYDSAVAVVCKYILPGVTDEELKQQLIEF